MTGTPAGSLGWGDRQGILAEKLKAAGVDKIEYSFFQSGGDAVSALFAGAVDVAAVGDNPALRARGRDPKVVLLALDSVNSDMQLIGARGGPTDIKGLVGKNITAPQGTIRDRTARQLIEAAGLTGKIEVKDVPTPESIAGLSSGQIDATVLSGASSVDLQEKGYPVIDSLSRHGMGSTGTNIALTSFTDGHPDFRAAWQQRDHRGQRRHPEELRRLSALGRRHRRHQVRVRQAVDPGRRVQHRAVPPDRRRSSFRTPTTS